MTIKNRIKMLILNVGKCIMRPLSSDKKLRQAKKFYQKGDINSARKACLEIIKKFPKNQRALKLLKNLSAYQAKIKTTQETNYHREYLIALYNEKKYSLVISQAMLFLEKSPTSFVLWNLLGAANLALEKTQEACLAFKRVTELNPKYAEGFNNLGISLEKQALYDDAIAAFEQATAINPHNTELFENLGKAFLASGKVDNAIKAYNAAISLQPNNPNTLMRLGTALAMQNKFDEAFESFDAAINLKPRDAEMHFNLGAILQDFGLLKRAISSYKTAISIQPNYANVWYNLGLTYRSQGEIEEAIISFKRTIELDPDYYEAKHLLSALLGNTTNSAPRQYVEHLFDTSASIFEKTLVDKLDYQIPQILGELIKKSKTPKLKETVLDLGCGTGLIGEELALSCSKIHGIDLSISMLAIAHSKNVYSELIHDDIIQFLTMSELDYQFFVAADVFIYVGELSEVFELIKSRNKRRGHLVFSTEHSEIDGYHLEKSGRYSHSKCYIDSLCCKYKYTIGHFSKKNLRKENGLYLEAGIYFLSF